MSTEKEIIQLIESAKVQVDTCEKLQRLMENKDFMSLIHDNYMTEYAASLVRSKAKYALQNEKDQAFLDNQINAIAHLNNFFEMILTQGDTAKTAIESYQNELDRVREGGE